jgi:outer membrane immunogenic protein
MPDPVCAGNPATASSTATNSSTRTGWTVGAGIDARIFGSWMLRAEYRYSDFGTWNNSLLLEPNGLATTTVNTNLKINTQIGMLGIGYRFGGPVVAKY